jgi:hypothetical protein
MAEPWKKYAKPSGAKPWEKYGSGAKPVQPQAQSQQEQALPWYTPFTSAPGNAADIVSGLAGGIKDQAMSMVENPMRMNPMFAVAQDIYKLAKPIAQNPQGAMDTAKQGLDNNFGTPTRAWNTLATHPVDVAMFAAPGLGIAGKGAELANMSKTAGALSKANSAIDPVNILAKPLAKLTARNSDKAILSKAPTRAEIEAQAGKMYDDISAQDFKFPGNDYEQLSGAVKNSFEKIGKEAAPISSAHRQSVIDLLKGEAGKTLTDPYTGAKTIVPDSRTVKYNDIEEIRRNASASSADMKLSDTERKVSGDLNKQIQELYKTIPGLTEKLGPAKELARRNILAKQIEEMGRKSEWYTSGNESGIKNQINAFGKKKGKTLTPQEEAAMKRVSQKEGLNSLLSTSGSRLGHLAVGGIGAALGGLPGFAAAEGLSLGARAISEASTLRALEKAKKTILLGKEGQKMLGANSKGKIANKALVRALLSAHMAQGETGIK